MIKSNGKFTTQFTSIGGIKLTPKDCQEANRISQQYQQECFELNRKKDQARAKKMRETIEKNKLESTLNSQTKQLTELNTKTVALQTIVIEKDSKVKEQDAKISDLQKTIHSLEQNMTNLLPLVQATPALQKQVNGLEIQIASLRSLLDQLLGSIANS
jgi:chromosome segregation ATPase